MCNEEQLNVRLNLRNAYSLGILGREARSARYLGKV